MSDSSHSTCPVILWKELLLIVILHITPSMTVKLLTEQHLEFLSLKAGCRGSSESVHGKMPHCWKSHVEAQIIISFDYFPGHICEQSFITAV